MKVTLLMFSALQWLRGTIEVHDEMDEMKQEQESMKLVPKVDILSLIFGDVHKTIFRPNAEFPRFSLR